MLGVYATAAEATAQADGSAAGEDLSPEGHRDDVDLVLVILMHRHRNNGLLLSELGDQMLGGERGPAGVKRIAKLLHSRKWNSGLILNQLWQQAR